MIERRVGPARRTVALATTGIVALGTAALVGWAAAVPVRGSASPVPGNATGAASVTTAQQLDAARANLQQVRRDLTRLTAREDDLPHVRLQQLSNLVAQLPAVQVPQQSVQPVTTHVAPPVTHTTSGASGAGP